MSNLKKERPIILNAQEVNAVLAGNKTQHRVMVEPDDETGAFSVVDYGKGWQAYKSSDGESILLDGGCEHRLLCPFGVTGDRLWVQEPSLIHCDWDWFYADSSLVECKEPFTPNDLHLTWDDKHQEYKGAISAEHLPRWASRLLLEITDIRIERVQNISGGDACAEGCPKFLTRHCFDASKPLADRNAVSWFAETWKENHSEQSYLSNPWVWVLEFKVVKASNKDAVQ